MILEVIIINNIFTALLIIIGKVIGIYFLINTMVIKIIYIYSGSAYWWLIGGVKLFEGNYIKIFRIQFINSLALYHLLINITAYFMIPIYLFFNKWVIILSISSVWGGIWAFQLYNWNGWWNWDGVESYNLILLLVIIMGYHKNFQLFWVTNILFWGKLIEILSLIMVARTWLGYVWSIHSFTTTNIWYEISLSGVLCYRIIIILGVIQYMKLKSMVGFKSLSGGIIGLIRIFYMRKGYYTYRSNIIKFYRHFLYWVMLWIFGAQNVKVIYWCFFEDHKNIIKVGKNAELYFSNWVYTTQISPFMFGNICLVGQWRSWSNFQIVWEANYFEFINNNIYF